MRTTLVIPDPVYNRAKNYAREKGKNLSQIFTEALDERLSREEGRVAEQRPTYRVNSRPMGQSKVDLSDRESLFDQMDSDS